MSTVVFGWEEQSDTQWGIQRCTFGGEIKILCDPNTGLIEGEDVPRGEWYVKFAQAKKRAIEIWKKRIEIAKQALKEIRIDKERV